MRLLCPNCDAQYEVDDSVIPPGGRDVQCSSCGQTWFQKSAAMLEEEGASPDDIEEPAAHPSDEPEQPHEPEPEGEKEPEHEAESEPEHEPEARQPDEAVLDVLREEAAHEAEARQNDAQEGLETQPDLGLDSSDDDGAQHAAAVRERTARLRGIEPEIDKNAARRDLLPDIEEINSTLRASADAEGLENPEEVEVQKSNRRGFRMGFSIVILVAVFLLLAYIYAPQIVEKVPAIEGFMNSYVETVNGLRMWLDQLMKTATDKMSGGAAPES